METTQTNLLEAIRSGDDATAAQAFYHLYGPMVHRFARRLGLPDADAEDVTQEVMLVVHKALRDRTFDRGKGKFHSWLFGVARRVALTRCRERQRRTRARGADSAATDLLGELAAHDDATRTVWDQEWRYSLLDTALREIQTTIGATALRAFKLYALDGYAPDVVAKRLGVSTSSVYVYKHRVLQAVRGWLRHFEQEDQES